MGAASHYNQSNTLGLISLDQMGWVVSPTFLGFLEPYLSSSIPQMVRGWIWATEHVLILRPDIAGTSLGSKFQKSILI